MATSKPKPRRAGPLTLGAYIHQTRSDRGISLRSLASKAKVSASSLCRLEQGDYVPVIQCDVGVLDRIWQVIGGDLNQILYLSRRCPLCRGGGTLREWSD